MAGEAQATADLSAPPDGGVGEIDEAAAFLTGDAGGEAEGQDDGIDPDLDLDADEAADEDGQGTSDDEADEAEESEGEGDEDEAEEAATEAPPQQKKRPNRTDRLKRVIERQDAQVQELRAKQYEWAEVANGIKLQRDHLAQENQTLRAALEQMGYRETPEAKQLREMRFAESQRQFSDEMRNMRAHAEAKAQAALQQERMLDAFFDEGEKLAEKHGIDHDLLMLRFAKGGMKVPLKDLAAQMSGRKIAARNATAKKQQDVNRNAPNPAKVRRGRSARPTKTPKVGNMESYIDAGVADIMKMRGL